MQWTSTQERFGAVSVLMHWLMALLVIFLFFLGRHMIALDYTDPWYKAAPILHKGAGLIVFILLLFRVFWRAVVDTRPASVPMPRWERAAAAIVQYSFYILLFGISLSGYLIPTAKGGGVEFFNLFELPALFSGIDHQEDMAGDAHYLLAYIIMALVLLHAMAALKHHFVERDETLTRMLGIKRKR